MRARKALIAVFTALAAVSCSREAPIVSLAVKDHSNATPWVAADGSFVAVAWGASRDGNNDVYVAVSRDGGRSFATPTRVNATAGEARLGGELPPRVALTPRTGADPAITVLWTARGDRVDIRTATSEDGGKTFSAPRTLQSPAAAGDRGWPSLALDASGKVHAIWLDHRGLAADRPPGAAHDHRSAKPHDGVAMAQKSGLYYAAADTPERELTKGVCYCCKTAMTIGRDGAIHTAWRQVYPGNLRDIAFTTSRDAGVSFSPPARVSADDWMIDGCPDDGPAMATDSSGTTHIVWPTVLKGVKPEGALFYANTRDGSTFSARTRIPTLGSIKPVHPQIVIDNAGGMLVAWDESVEGQRVAAARSITVGSNGRISFGEIIKLDPQGSAMYPVMAATDSGVIAVWTSRSEPSVVRAKRLQIR